MKSYQKIRDFLFNENGAVTMEYVLLCLLIAAASVMMVVSFSRALVRQFALVSYSMTGYSSDELKDAQERFREDVEGDAVVGRVYSDYMHGEHVLK